MVISPSHYNPFPTKLLPIPVNGRCVHVCVCACVRVCVRACVRVCVCACLRVFMVVVWTPHGQKPRGLHWGRRGRRRGCDAESCPGQQCACTYCPRAPERPCTKGTQRAGLLTFTSGVFVHLMPNGDRARLSAKHACTHLASVVGDDVQSRMGPVLHVCRVLPVCAHGLCFDTAAGSRPHTRHPTGRAGSFRQGIDCGGFILQVLRLRSMDVWLPCAALAHATQRMPPIVLMSAALCTHLREASPRARIYIYSPVWGNHAPAWVHGRLRRLWWTRTSKKTRWCCAR